jgi:hypothetical protein
MISTQPWPIFVGDSWNETMATEVAFASIRAHSGVGQGARYHGHPVRRLSRTTLGKNYSRPTELRDGRLWDTISAAPMSTDHAIARFFVPWLCEYQGWALFVDGDVLCRRSIDELFACADDRYAVMCVQHPPLDATGLKKTGDKQTIYQRKNWSSVMLLNCAHAYNIGLTLDVLNSWTGRDLHGFKWLPDALVGPLDRCWNWLANVSLPMENPALVHYTEGTPSIPGHETDPFAREWFSYAQKAGYDIPLSALKAVS